MSAFHSHVQHFLTPNVTSSSILKCQNMTAFHFQKLTDSSPNFFTTPLRLLLYESPTLPRHGLRVAPGHKWVVSPSNGRFIVGFIKLLIITLWKSRKRMLNCCWMIWMGTALDKFGTFYRFFKRSCCSIAVGSLLFWLVISTSDCDRLWLGMFWNLKLVAASTSS